MKEIKNINIVYDDITDEVVYVYAVIDGKKTKLKGDKAKNFFNSELPEFIKENDLDETEFLQANACKIVKSSFNDKNEYNKKIKQLDFLFDSNKLAVNNKVIAGVIAAGAIVLAASGLKGCSNTQIYDTSKVITQEETKDEKEDDEVSYDSMDEYFKNAPESFQKENVKFAYNLTETLGTVAPKYAYSFDLYYNLIGNSKFSLEDLYKYLGGQSVSKDITTNSDNVIIALIDNLTTAKSEKDIISGKDFIRSKDGAALWDKYCKEYYGKMVEALDKNDVTTAKKIYNEMLQEFNKDYVGNGKSLLNDASKGIVLHVLTNALAVKGQPLPNDLIMSVVGEVDTERKGIMDNICSQIDSRISDYDKYCLEIQNLDNQVIAENAAINTQITTLESKNSVLTEELVNKMSKYNSMGFFKKWFNGKELQKEIEELKLEIAANNKAIRNLKESLKVKVSDQLLEGTMKLDDIVLIHTRDFVITHLEKLGITIEEFNNMSEKEQNEFLEEAAKEITEQIHQQKIEETVKKIAEQKANRPVAQGGGKKGDKTSETVTQTPVNPENLTPEVKEEAIKKAEEQTGIPSAEHDPYATEEIKKQGGTFNPSEGQTEEEAKEEKYEAADKEGQKAIETGEADETRKRLEKEAEEAGLDKPGNTDNSEKLIEESEKSLEEAKKDLEKKAEEAKGKDNEVTIVPGKNGDIIGVEVIDRTEDGKVDITTPDGEKIKVEHPNEIEEGKDKDKGQTGEFEKNEPTEVEEKDDGLIRDAETGEVIGIVLENGDIKLFDTDEDEEITEETPVKTDEETPVKTDEETPATPADETPVKTDEETPVKTDEETPATPAEETTEDTEYYEPIDESDEMPELPESVIEYNDEFKDFANVSSTEVSSYVAEAYGENAGRAFDDLMNELNNPNSTSADLKVALENLNGELNINETVNTNGSINEAEGSKVLVKTDM